MKVRPVLSNIDNLTSSALKYFKVSSQVQPVILIQRYKSKNGKDKSLSCFEVTNRENSSCK